MQGEVSRAVPHQKISNPTDGSRDVSDREGVSRSSRAAHDFAVTSIAAEIVI